MTRPAAEHASASGSRSSALVGFELARTRVGRGAFQGRARPGARPAWLLCLRDGSGRLGWGEAAPLPGVSLESADQAGAALAGVAERLRGFEPRADFATEREVARALAPAEEQLEGIASARFALESALVDLIAVQRGVSAAECLGGPRRFREVAVNAVIDAADDGALPAALALAASGVPALKVKVAGEAQGWSRELAVLEALRAALPSGFEMRVDVNGGWDIETARARMAELSPIAPRFVEQPVAPAELLDLGATLVPWAADESLAVAGLAERLMEAPGCAAFVLKPHALGLLRALQLGRLAQRRGLQVVVTHFFDGPMGLAAACELALALPAPPLACGLFPHDDPTSKVPQLAKAGRCRAVKRPGLGLHGR
jgi:L-alanine-DL-glutamate epimerase-like enolase superfamily enzyme